MNPTAEKFRYAETLIQEYEHWVVLLRLQQVTLGSLVLCNKSDATAFSALPNGAYAEMGTVVRDIEKALGAAIEYEKINYLMLMMSDPNVHFHVFPRYAGSRSACGVTIADSGWPGPPLLAEARELTAEEGAAIREHIASFW